jgi:hypothetical protein
MCSYSQRSSLLGSDVFRDFIVILGGKIESVILRGLPCCEDILQPQINTPLLGALSQCARQ